MHDPADEPTDSRPDDVDDPDAETLGFAAEPRRYAGEAPSIRDGLLGSLGGTKPDAGASLLEEQLRKLGEG